jgi:type II secretory pathway component PulM
MKYWLASQLEQSLALQTLLSAYSKRSYREQRLMLLLLMGGAVIVLLNLTVIPLYKDNQQAKKRLDDVKSTYMFLAQNADVIATSDRSKEQKIDRTSTELRSIVNTTSKKAEITPEVISREGQSQLRIGISKVPYEKLAVWLTELSRKDIQIKSTQIQAISPGVVSLNIVLD